MTTALPSVSTALRLGLVSIVVLASATGCNTVRRLQEVGVPPPLAAVENPTANPNYRAVSMPMPAPEPRDHQANSMWRRGAKAFFKDQRAARVGDILSVRVTIDEKAEVENTTQRSRNNTEGLGSPSFFGYEASLNRILPQAVNPSSLVDLNSNTSSLGTGTVDRKEQITFTVAAVVTQLLPNGNLAINAHQEVRVNFEVREILVAGVVRPEDISSANTIDHTQIAEARISYGGRGQISDVQQPRYGQQVLDILLPF